MGDSAAQRILADAGSAYAILLAGFTTMQVPGPARTRTCGTRLTGARFPALLASLEPLNDETAGPGKLREAVAQHEAQRADFIKIFASKNIRKMAARR